MHLIALNLILLHPGTLSFQRLFKLFTFMSSSIPSFTVSKAKVPFCLFIPKVSTGIKGYKDFFFLLFIYFFIIYIEMKQPWVYIMIN